MREPLFQYPFAQHYNGYLNNLRVSQAKQKVSVGGIYKVNIFWFISIITNILRKRQRLTINLIIVAR